MATINDVAKLAGVGIVGAFSVISATLILFIVKKD